MESVRIVIQCRLNSSRLPAKALLPVADMPVFKLCALRASNTGIDTCIATSNEAADELISQILDNCCFKVYRGPLNDVLRRFVQATADMSPEDIIVRLTADNLFPDGEFIQKLVDEFKQSGLKYLGTFSPLDGLPYGMSAEAFTVGVLREADMAAESKYDREHVTPWIKRNYDWNIFKPGEELGDLSYLRCTIDTFEDYLRVEQVFREVNDPINVTWNELCTKLGKLSDAPRFRIPYTVRNGQIHSRFSLGTAQLGMVYGVANQTGMPSMEEVSNIINTAVSYGVTSFDTARAYGDSENRLGQCLFPYKDRVNIITKLSPLNNLPADALKSTISNAVDASIFRSCRELKLSTLATVLIHNPEHLYLYDGIVWKRLEELRDEGVIGILGVSVYNPQQLDYAVENYKIEHIQLPLNLLDWRWREANVEEILSKNPDIMVHARSIYLQGILLSNQCAWPDFAKRDSLNWIKRLHRLAYDLGRESVQELCIAYILGQEWIDSTVIGTESLLQLEQNLELFLKTPLTSEECKYVESILAGASERLLNPSLW